jgi:hypothetical protein
MKQLVTSRAALLMAGLAVAVVTACSDSGTLNLAGPNPAVANGPGGSRDTSKTGGGRDSTGSRTPTAKFALVVHVGTPRPGSADTLSTDPVPGSVVTISEETYTFVHVPGADTVHLNMTVVATGAPDANGNVTFANLKGASIYQVKAEGPPGSPLRASTTFINQAFADTVKIQLTLHGL